MPQVTVYIRQEDIELWRGVVRKSEFMHNALADDPTYVKENVPIRTTVGGPLVTLPLNEVLAAEVEDEEPFWHATFAIDRATGKVVDTEEQDYAEDVTPAMLIWLKQNNKYV